METNELLSSIKDPIRIPPKPQHNNNNNNNKDKNQISSPPMTLADTDDFQKDLDAIAEAFKENVKCEDRKYLLKTYPRCFVAKEAVDYLVQSGAALNRQDAVELGRALQSTFLFEHVTRDHQFSDGYLFFRFLDKGERGEFKVDDQTGEKMDWTKFLSPSVALTAHDRPLQPKFRSPDLEHLHPKDIHVASQLWPMDQYNTTLLNHVHPPQWQDPTPNTSNRDGCSTYDLVVIGGGTGGLISASGSAGVGAKVAMIEEHMLGGDWYVGRILCVYSW
jgi:hypothetical protein